MHHEDIGPCCVCQQPAQAVCSRCTAVAYCGPACQRQHWRLHKPACRRRDDGEAEASGGAPPAAGAAKEGPSSPPEAPARRPPAEAGAAGSSPSSSSTAGAAGGGSGPGPGPGADGDGRPAFVAAPRRSASGVPGEPAPFDVVLSGQRSVENAQRVVDTLRERGVCVIKAGADKTFQRALLIESRLLCDQGAFGEAQKGSPVSPGSDQIIFNSRDDRIIWMTNDWMDQNEKRCKALKVLNGQLGDFGWGLKTLLEEQLGLDLRQRTPGMLACYDGETVPGARYDFHIDNPYQTNMEVPDDRRRLTLIYYISDGPWDVQDSGGALQVCLNNPRRAPRTTAEALQYEKVTVAPECDTMVCFFSHTMYHAVLPVVGKKRRFGLSTWFTLPPV